MSIFKGAAVAIITPMTETQEVNYEKLGELIEEQIAGGTDAIVICGTTGEASTLSHEEHLDAIKYTVEKVNHRIPVIAGTGSNSTETAIYLSQEAEKYGVDGLLHISQISTQRIKHPSAVLTEGQTVKVKILSAQEGKLSLSMKVLAEQTADQEAHETFDYKETGSVSTGLGDLLKGLKL